MASVPMSVERAQSILDGHNCQRARYNMPALQWDWGLANEAKAHADQCVFAHSTNLQPIDEGENLSANESTVGPEQWFAEESNWVCGAPTESSCKGGQCGHWTAAVWKSTTHVGCGIANNCAGILPRPSNYLVCRYSPAGNILGQPPFDKQYCTPNASINCANPENANFPRPQVPPLPGGSSSTTTAPQQQQGGGGVQQQQQGGMLQGGRGQQQQGAGGGAAGTGGNSQKGGNKDNQTQLTAATDAQNFQNEQTQLQQQQQQQQQKGNQLIVNGVTISYSPDQSSAVNALSDDDKVALAEALRNIPPFTQPSAIAIFLQNKNMQNSGIRQIYPRDSQIPVLNQLNAAQYNDLYAQIKDIPPNAQNCGIEAYLVQQGLAQPTEQCTQLQQSNTVPAVANVVATVPVTAPPPATTTATTPPPATTTATTTGTVPSGANAAPAAATAPAGATTSTVVADTKPLSADASIVVRPYVHPSDVKVPNWGWALIAIACVLVVAAIITAIYFIRKRSKKEAAQEQDVGDENATPSSEKTRRGSRQS